MTVILEEFVWDALMEKRKVAFVENSSGDIFRHATNGLYLGATRLLVVLSKTKSALTQNWNMSE